MSGMKQSTLIVSLAILLLVSMSATAGAQDIEYYGVDASIGEDLSVRNKVVFQFSELTNHFNYELNFPIYNLRVSSDFDFADCLVNNKQDSATVSCDFIGMSRTKNTLTLEFDTRNQIRRVGENYQLVVDYSINNPVQRSFIIINLPEFGILAADNQSFFPVDGKTLLTDDGRKIAVYWEDDPTDQNQLQFSVTYNTPNVGGPFYSFLLAALTFIVIVVMIAVAVYIRRDSRPADVVRSVLNSDEKRIVDILSEHKGKAGQKILVRESDFSKAKVSRIVNSLKSRGVVSTEPISGRENRVILSIERPKREEKNERETRQDGPGED
jgi:uncharacterized membrane protein